MLRCPIFELYKTHYIGEYVGVHRTDNALTIILSVYDPSALKKIFNFRQSLMLKVFSLNL